MLLVAHDVDKAVFLGDLVMAMEPYPGHILRIVDTDLPRLRHRSDAAYLSPREDALPNFIEPDRG